MEITGTIYKILPTEEVTLGDDTKKTKGGFVIMRDGEYAKPVAFELFGEDRLEILNGLTLNIPVKVNFLPVSFECKNGGYYTTLRCTIIMPLAGASGFASAGNTLGTSNNTPTNGGLQWNPTGSGMPQDKPFNQLPSDEQLPFENDLPFF